MPTDKDKAERTRKVAPVSVEYLRKGSEGFAWCSSTDSFSTEAAARKWLKENLEENVRYRILKTLYEGVPQVHTKQTVKL